jgi:hypothetical protein
MLLRLASIGNQDMAALEAFRQELDGVVSAIAMRDFLSNGSSPAAPDVS